jgi:WD40 repeat protein
VNRQAIQRLVFAADSNTFVAVSPGGTLRLWDVASSQQLGPPWIFPGGRKGEKLGQEISSMQVAFSADGRWLATLGADRLLRLWPVPKANLSLREMELRTWTSLGAEMDTKGARQSLPGLQWQTLRQELRALEARGQPPAGR